MEGIEEPLARIAGNAYVMDAAASITYGIMLGEKTGGTVGYREVPLHHTAASSPLLSTRWMRTGVKALCWAGGFRRAYRGAPIATVEGANILTRSMMIFVVRAPFIAILMYWKRWLQRGNNDVNAFDNCCLKHIGHVGSNTVRSFWQLTRGLTGHTPTGDLPAVLPASERYRHRRRCFV